MVKFFALWLILWLPFAILGVVKLKWRPFQPSTPAQKLPLLAALYLIAPWLLMAVTPDDRCFALYGLPWRLEALPPLLGGLVVGSLGLLGLFWVQQAAGWVQVAGLRVIEGSRVTEGLQAAGELRQQASPDASLSRNSHNTNWQSIAQVLALLLLGLWVGWTEELIFRGFLQTQLEQNLTVWQAATLASLIFALLHGVWEGRGVVPQLPGLWLMGMVLVLSRQTSQGFLGFAWGLHAGWVWTLASLDTLQMLHYRGNVPDWITGIGGKPLAGLMGLGFLGLTALGLGVLGEWRFLAALV